MRDTNLLSDLESFLRQAEFMECGPKYVREFRSILECPSHTLMLKLLDEGKDKLLQWFEWVAPWTTSVEATRPGRLLWLSVQGVPLHAWTPANFYKITSEWGKVLEVEDLTESCTQTHIGRICVLTKLQHSIDEVIELLVDGEPYPVNRLTGFI